MTIPPLIEPQPPVRQPPPTIPLVAYSVLEAASAGAATPRTIATCRSARSADYLVRVLEQMRAKGELFGPDHDGLRTFCTTTARDEVTGGSVDDAIAAGYTVRATVTGAGADGGDADVEISGALPRVVASARQSAATGADGGPLSKSPAGVRGLL